MSETRLTRLKQEMLTEQDELSNYFDNLPDAKKQKINQTMARMRTGLYAVAPIICAGPERCPFIQHCPIPDKVNGKLHLGDINMYPRGLPCIMEAGYMKNKILDYFEYLQVDPLNPIEVALVNELAVIDLYKNRALMVLSVGDKDGYGQDLLRIDVTAVSDSGRPIATSTQLHPVFVALDRLENRREKILKSLLETRKDKAELKVKLGANEDNDKMMAQIVKIREALEAKSKQITEITEEEVILIE
jgi:hypothetical protein